ncbi:MAG TPA: hypothetical protein VE173_03665, partial [Longimicrobiales bacterium]|nr:hypothetical protein [Longimicrobiales bacterium]
MGSIPTPRPVVVFSGARIRPDSARLDSIDHWVQIVTTTIQEDPSFLVVAYDVPREAYPWETLEVPSDDSVRVGLERGPEGAEWPYEIYGFLHLMKRVDRLGEFFPEAADLEGYDLERFILARTADDWLLGRTVYATAPYAPLDEIIYAQDRGYLDAMIFTARPDDFP